jgi:lipid-binding SYLF domain-containing protein
MLKKLIASCLLLLVGASVFGDEFDTTLANFRAADGTEKFFSEAYGYAVLPVVGKGGIGIGGAYGKGRVFRGSAYVGDTALFQLSIGFQLGGQAYSQIIFFQDENAFNRFTSGSFEFGAEASAVALTLGVQAKAGTTGASASGNESSSGDASMAGGWSSGMAVFTLAKGGLMYEASIGGQKFNYQPKSISN